MTQLSLDESAARPAVQVACRHCRAAVVLHFATWHPEAGGQRQLWWCPHCGRPTFAELAGELISVRRADLLRDVSLTAKTAGALNPHSELLSEYDFPSELDGTVERALHPGSESLSEYEFPSEIAGETAQVPILVAVSPAHGSAGPQQLDLSPEGLGPARQVHWTFGTSQTRTQHAAGRGSADRRAELLKRVEETVATFTQGLAWAKVMSRRALRRSWDEARLSWHRSRRFAAAMLAAAAPPRLRTIVACMGIALISVMAAGSRLQLKPPSLRRLTTIATAAPSPTVSPAVSVGAGSELGDPARAIPPAVAKSPARVATAITRARTPRIPPSNENVGSLTVDSLPSGGQVFLNQVPVGVTPLKLPAVQARAYAIQIQVDGYSRWSRGIYVTMNQQTRIVATLEPAR